MLPTAPRHFMPSPGLPGAGLPHDRMARVAARQAFVVLKATFLHAVEDLDGTDGDWLRHQVRAAEEPSDLWLLRAPVFAALDGVCNERRGRRQTLRRSLEAMFPDSAPASGFVLF
jgi:hypothetical protein